MKPGVHKLNHSRLLNRVVVIGCGGTGACLIGGLPFLDQALEAAGHSGLQVIVADGDRISATNCVRQPFSESEVGLFKSTVLVNRLNLFWGLKWQASTEYVTKDTEGRADIIISCVDTRAARHEIVRSPLLRECVYWLDIGNSADGGQFVLGQPQNNRNRKTRGRLPTAAEVALTTFIDMTGDEGSAPTFFVLLGLWFLAALLAMAQVDIMCALLYCEAREMDVTPMATAAPGDGDDRP